MKTKTLYKYCKLNLHYKIANFNYKVQNCILHQNEILDVLSLFWNRTKLDDCNGQPVVSKQRYLLINCKQTYQKPSEKMKLSSTSKLLRNRNTRNVY